MAKASNQKEKILALINILSEKTDEDHRLSMQQILDELATYDITAERKSIYDDFEVLRKFGFDVIFRKDKPSGYYLAERNNGFALAELKLLVDAVWSSKFITSKKTHELILKLSGLTSSYNAGKLKRQVMVSERVKSMNESIFYNVDDIHTAIASDKKIQFDYYEWRADKTMELKHNGKRYEVSPWMLYWNDEYYYLIAYDNNADMIKYYRVDKMKKIELLGEKRTGKVQFDALEKDFSKATFGMFAGENVYVTMHVENRLAGVIIDRFGKDVHMRKLDKEKFSVSTNVKLSSQFFGWLCGLGNGINIVSPENVREEYRQYLEGILENYKKDS